jgi:molybdopterin-guanine dinucleotide biosynthesis protein A
MGVEHKGLIELTPGQTIVGRLLDELATAGLSDTVIVANDRERYLKFGKVVIPDLRPGLGPLAGIEAALAYASDSAADGVLFLPCDMPAISSEQIRPLRDAFRRRPAGVKVAVVEGRPRQSQPLCCIVHRDILSAVRAALDEGRLKVEHLWLQLGAEEVVFHDPAPFFNANTPAEVECFRGRGRSMPIRLLVPEALREKVAAFVRARSLQIELADAEPCDVRIVLAAGGQESDMGTLRAGGYIKCSTAWELCGKHGVPLRELGALLDLLDIRVRECCLGCFR